MRARCTTTGTKPFAGREWLAAGLLLLLLAPSMAEASGAPAGKPHSGTTARAIERNLPTYPKEEAMAGREGWVVLSYVVAKDGSVQDILVADSSGVRAFERAAKRAASGWRYEPATLNGKPTQQCHTSVLMPFEMQMAKSQRGARSHVARAYKKAAKALTKGDPAEAQRIIDEARERRSFNLYEGARVAFLESMIARATGDAEEERSRLGWALISNGNYIEEKFAVAAWERIFVLDVEARRFSLAIDTYEKMVEILGEDEISERVAAKAAELRGFAGRDVRYGIPGSIPEPRLADEVHGVWSHKMFFRTVSFETEDIEALEEYDLRCDFHRAKGRPKPDRAIRVPEEWGDCRLYVFGEPGADFELIEYGGTP